MDLDECKDQSVLVFATWSRSRGVVATVKSVEPAGIWLESPGLIAELADAVKKDRAEFMEGKGKSLLFLPMTQIKALLGPA
jgi:hypothetical protein